jgi:hypothetical protein
MLRIYQKIIFQQIHLKNFFSNISFIKKWADFEYEKYFSLHPNNSNITDIVKFLEIPKKSYLTHIKLHMRCLNVKNY